MLDYESLNPNNGNSVEARRTVLDSYLYHENDEHDLDTALHYDYGKLCLYNTL